jgi:hypothetical protein
MSAAYCAAGQQQQQSAEENTYVVASSISVGSLATMSAACISRGSVQEQNYVRNRNPTMLVLIGGVSHQRQQLGHHVRSLKQLAGTATSRSCLHASNICT